MLKISKAEWSGPESSRWWFGMFFATATGILTVTIVGQWGEGAIRSLILAGMIGLFVAGGMLLGLIAARHISDTHLPDPEDEDTPATEPVRWNPATGMLIPASTTAVSTAQRPRGYRGLFGLDPAASLPSPVTVRSTGSAERR